METVLIIGGILFVIGFIVALYDDKSLSEARDTGCGCVIAAIIIRILFFIICQTCSNWADPDSGLNRQIRDGYNLYD